ncbi:MAG: hypothetical protein ACKVVP_04270 [Chloroflexota bacterium]
MIWPSTAGEVNASTLRTAGNQMNVSGAGVIQATKLEVRPANGQPGPATINADGTIVTTGHALVGSLVTQTNGNITATGTGVITGASVVSTGTVTGSTLQATGQIKAGNKVVANSSGCLYA